MLARLFALFAVLCVLVSAENLRGDTTATVVQAQSNDNGMLARAAKRMVHTATSSIQKDGARIKESTTKSLKAIKTTGKQVSSVSSATVNRGNSYMITRHRPNGDCSGPTSAVTASSVGGNCQEMNGNSYFSGCGRADQHGNIPLMNAFFYGVPDCSGEPYSVTQSDLVMQCQMNFQEYNNTGPEMIGHQCTTKVDLMQDEKPGLLIAMYPNTVDMCNGPPLSYYNMRLGACTLNIDFGSRPEGDFSEETTYTYSKWDSCTPEGMVTMSLYSDSACTRVLHAGNQNLSNQFDGFNSCAATHNAQGVAGYTMAKCIPPRN